MCKRARAIEASRNMLLICHVFNLTKFGIKPTVNYNRASRACNIVQYNQAGVILNLRYSPV